MVDERIVRISDEYGYDAQSRQCIEEMSELTQTINKFWRKHLKCASNMKKFRWLLKRHGRNLKTLECSGGLI